ncbi:hypothetical protein [Kibdelosporangium aridum]|uniref:Lipoprotein n=1 Tax=Kibdelosporangium aridum TaxID=2030 RepID=A0A1W2FKE6_KIBAR|nr:hypothetical protein [Kibdelosporangium aridum]SMD22078.1 hypothetical protein SAMN05661093_07310 [Kibdelosporangium aridum]
MPGRALVGLLLLALTACSPQQPPPDQGLGQPITSIDDLASLVKERAGGCRNVQTGTPQEFRQFVGTLFADMYQPYVTEWATCSVSADFPRVGLVLFKDFKEFQASWRDAMTAGRVSDSPQFSFGNGYAVTQGYLGTAKLGLFYLRCNYNDPKVHQIPADVEGCVFANPEHRGHGH